MTFGTLLALCACRQAASSPTAPTIVPPPVAKIVLVPNAIDLPSDGGSAVLILATAANDVGNAAAPFVTVALTASTGSLSASSIQTDSSGHAKVTWTGTTSATITARASGIVSTAEIHVVGLAPPAPAPEPPAPGPSPQPSPTPTPPAPTPTPPPPASPAGDLIASITATPQDPDENQKVTLSVALSSTTGGPVPAIVGYTWDVNGDRLPDRTESSPVVSYPAGTVTPFVEVHTADNRFVDASLTLNVGVAPAITATLDAGASSADLGVPVTFRTAVTSSGNVGTLTFAWDFDGNGSIDATTSTNTTSTSYTTIGTKTPKVTVTGSRAGRVTASTSITISAPALIVVVTVSPSGAQPAGTPLVLTATVSSTGPVPAGMTFGWDFNSDGAIDETTTGSPSSTGHAIYSTSGTKIVTVTVTAPDGRTTKDVISVNVT